MTWGSHTDRPLLSSPSFSSSHSLCALSSDYCSFSMFCDSYYWRKLTNVCTTLSIDVRFLQTVDVRRPRLTRNYFSPPPSYLFSFEKKKLPTADMKHEIMCDSFVLYCFKVLAQLFTIHFRGWSSRNPIHSFKFGWLLFVFHVAHLLCGTIAKKNNYRFKFP